MSGVVGDRRTSLVPAAMSVVICAAAVVVSWFVVTQLGVWFGYLGLALSISVVIGLTVLAWVKSRFGIAWAVGSAIGALPTFVAFWFFF